MIRRLQVLNYRCLRHVDVALGRFHVLAGATGAGKSAFLDALGFLSDLVRDGPDAAVGRRTHDFPDLAWGRPGDKPRFEMAAEFEIPPALRDRLAKSGDFRRFRYELAMHDPGAGPGIEFERGILIPAAEVPDTPQELLFSDPPPPPASIPPAGGRRGSRTVFSKSAAGNDNFNVETAAAGNKGWTVHIALGPHRSTLANLPDTPDSLPASTHVRQLLAGGIERIAVDRAGLRRQDAPGRRAPVLEPDGGNLARAVQRFGATDPGGFAQWLAHLRSAIPGLHNLSVRESDGGRYASLRVHDATGLELPAQAAADGTLRLIALTLLPHLLDDGAVCLLRNPEFELDAASLQAVYRSLSAASKAQLLATTCSPGFLNCAAPEEILGFSRDAEGAASVVAGPEHPDFEAWSSTRDNTALFAPELLG